MAVLAVTVRYNYIVAMRVRIISVANKRYAHNIMRAETKKLDGNPFFADQE